MHPFGRCVAFPRKLRFCLRNNTLSGSSIVAMHFSYTLSGVLAVLLLVVGAGCSKPESSPPQASATPEPLNSNTLVRVHWQGERNLGVNGSAYYFMRLLELADSQELESASFDKLARYPWRSFGEAAAGPSGFLRPLLDDILLWETFVEARQAPGQSIEYALAIRLSEERARVWFTNLAGAAQSITGLAPTTTPARPKAWEVKAEQSPRFIQLDRVGEWTLVGVAESENTLFAEILERTRQEQAPAPMMDDWIAVDLDLQRLMGTSIGEGMPRVSFSVTGDGARAITSGQMVFPQPLQINSAPWTTPMSLLHEPLASFTAVRGVTPLLSSLAAWDFLKLGEAPNQLFSWSLEGHSYRTYVAVPLHDARVRVGELTERALNEFNPWLTEREYVAFRPLSESNGATWGNSTDLQPFFTSVRIEEGEFLYAGLFPDIEEGKGAALRPTVFEEIKNTTNLVYYSWENTPKRIEPWLFMGQNIRVISHHAQLPMSSLSSVWLSTLRSRLDASETIVTLTAPNELSFSRVSSTGFTAVEVHLLADWFESPNFPFSLQSLFVEP